MLLGVVRAYRPNLHLGFVYMNSAFNQPEEGEAEALRLFVGYLWSTFRLRKIYVEQPDIALDRYTDALPELREEGRLREDST